MADEKAKRLIKQQNLQDDFIEIVDKFIKLKK
jgi:hypothetical protein